MDRQEAIQTLSKVGKISVSYAEDLYDSFFPKPVVPQYVADWYEKNKGSLDESIWEYLVNWDDGSWSDFKQWMYPCDSSNAIQTLINMHQFGYEVEKEKRYTVTIKAVLGQHLGRYYLNEELTPQFSRAQFTVNGERPTFTRKELEDTGFGWVFDCEGIEIEEVE